MTYEEPKSGEELAVLLGKPGKILLYYTASWCGPCKAMSKPFSDSSDQNPTIKYIKADIDVVSSYPPSQGVAGVPTFIAFNNGQKIDEVVGANPQKFNQLVATLAAL